MIGAAGSSRVPALRIVAAFYVETMRNIPLLVHMYFWFMALAFLRLPAFGCAVLGLAMYSGAYVAEVVRSGIGSIPRGQTQAGLATGLTAYNTFRLIVYPQAVRVIAPSLASVFSQLIKDSSLASVIAVAELTYQAGAIEGQTFRTFEVYITISLLYLAFVTTMSALVMMFPGASDTSLARRTADA